MKTTTRAIGAFGALTALSLVLAACGGAGEGLVVVSGAAFSQETLNDENNVKGQQKVLERLAKQPPAAGTEVPAGLNDAANAAFRKALQQKLGAWPKLVEYDPAKPVTVVFTGRYGGYSEYDNDYSHVTTKTVRYQSGTEQVPNPAARELVEEHNSLMDRYNQVAAAGIM